MFGLLSKVSEMEQGKWNVASMKWYKFVDYLVVKPKGDTLQLAVVDVDPTNGEHTIEKVFEFHEGLIKRCKQANKSEDGRNFAVPYGSTIQEMNMKALVDFKDGTLDNLLWEEVSKYARYVPKEEVEFPLNLFGCSELHWK